MGWKSWNQQPSGLVVCGIFVPSDDVRNDYVDDDCFGNNYVEFPVEKEKAASTYFENPSPMFAYLSRQNGWYMCYKSKTCMMPFGSLTPGALLWRLVPCDLHHMFQRYTFVWSTMVQSVIATHLNIYLYVSLGIIISLLWLSLEDMLKPPTAGPVMANS